MLRTIAALVSLGAVVSAAEMFPFVLPWDDASETVISRAHLNDKPAGRDGFVRVKDGHLFAGEKQLRIFGVNVCFGANFPTKEAAEKVAARMAKFGINCVRFHHMDMFSAPSGIFAKDGKTLDPEQLDRLDFFIAKLKEHGIYTNLNLHVSRTYPDMPKAEKKGSPSYDKGVDNYVPALIALQKDYARDLLHHKNPYTGKTYAEEPAVAFVEVNNENALGFQWWAGEMDELPAPYAAELEKLWGAWVTAKYQDDDKVHAAWSEGARPDGPELLPVQKRWHHESHGGADAKGEHSPDNIRVVVEKPGIEPWHVQFSHGGLKVEKGKIYEISFSASYLTQPVKWDVTVALQQAQAPWKLLANETATVRGTGDEVSVLLRAADSEDSARISIGGMGLKVGEFAFRDFSVHQAGVYGGLARTIPEGRIHYLKKRAFSRYTKRKQEDWQQFLWDTEIAYWNGMRDFLKKDLGVKAPIVGTQGFWSPAHVQAGMDVIDSHAYWHHPDFHGRGWNQEVWSVKNESMAGAPEGGELGRLAAQRVAGKPFICTEYNHPAPNTYSAETFPLLLAFAAAQDWDGVFAFSYSHRAGDAWDQAHFNNFFDIDRHSAKMATLPAAVATFRRGDVPALAIGRVLQLSAADTLESGLRSGPGFMRHRPEFKETGIFEERFAGSAELGETRVERSGEKAGAPAMRWDLEKRIATVNAPRAKLLVGKLTTGEARKLGDLTVTPGGTRQGWGCYQALVLDGKDFASAKRILITATGDTENTGMQWTSPAKISVARNWGKAPVLVEGPAATIELLGGGKLKAFALDETGARREEIPMTGNRLEIGPQHRTLWYEVVRE